MNTKTKIALARVLYRSLRLLGVRQHQVITRMGVRFEVDLAEGIDLSLFLFGSFQKWVFASPHIPRCDGFTALDIGANIGAICLPLAASRPGGRIIAVEPTEHAFARLRKNLDLNPDLRSRIVPVNAFMNDGSAPQDALTACPSWRLDDAPGERHAIHLGQVHQVECPTLSIDSLVASHGLTKLHFIKIDTDGHEFGILQGGQKTLEQHRPALVFEFCFYENEKRGRSFNDFQVFFDSLGYEIRSNDGSVVVKTEKDARRLVPELGSHDFIAVPLPR